jgi:hypothetical protein
MSLYEKVVIRYKDGRMLKCEILKHFSFAERSFKAITRGGKVEAVPVQDLKAVFFVHELDGRTEYHEKQSFALDTGPRAGRRAEVHFLDGEIMRGRVIRTDENANGFFVEPSDSESNNRRVFVFRSAIKEVRFPDGMPE